MDLVLAKERAKQQSATNVQSIERQRQPDKSLSDSQQKILKNALLNSTVNSNGNNLSAIDVVSGHNY